MLEYLELTLSEVFLGQNTSTVETCYKKESSADYGMGNVQESDVTTNVGENGDERNE